MRAETTMLSHILTPDAVVLTIGLLAMVAVAPIPGVAQEPGALPFGPGETLVYEGRFGAFGSVGIGVLMISEEEMEGRPVLRFDFDFEGRVALMSVRDHTSSWMDPGTMTSLRYEKNERHPLGSREESVRIFPAERRWEDAHGPGGETPSADPLDELSFLFYLRTLDLEPGTRHTLDRHFDHARSPVEVRVLREDTIRVPLGEFAVTVVEMRVTDPERFGGDGRVTLSLAHDEFRTPVRIESAMPVAGSLTLSLKEGWRTAQRTDDTRRSSTPNPDRQTPEGDLR